MTRRDFIVWGMRGLAVAATLDAFWFEKAVIEWKEFTIRKSPNPSAALSFVQISDLHLNRVDDVLRDAAYKINASKPDLIFFSGDAIDRKENLPLLDEFLRLFNHDIPKAAILGNWEYWGNVDVRALEAVYETANCRLLINQGAPYVLKGKTVLVTGFDDLVGGHPDPGQAFREYCSNDYHVVLNHCPQFRDTLVVGASKWPAIDVVLAGHTHGGQINMLGFVPVVPPGSGKYMKGWYKEAHPHMYVSRGVGTSVVPVRFGARAEITTFRVEV